MSEPTDSRGRELFTVHPEILAGGAHYRPVEPAQNGTEKTPSDHPSATPLAAANPNPRTSASP